MGVVGLQSVSMHAFRSSRRRAAIERKEAELQEMKVELARLQMAPRAKFIVVERIVEVPIEKIIETVVEVPVEKGVVTLVDNFIAEDMEAAFAKGTQVAFAAKKDLEETFMNMHKDNIDKYEKKLKDAADETLRATDVDKENTMKDMLRKLLEENHTLKDSSQMCAKLKENDKKLREENANLKGVVDLYKQLKEDAGKLRQENAVLKKKVAEIPIAHREGSELQQKISEISGAEVPRKAVDELVRRFGHAGEVLDDDSIQTLFDCKVFDIWKAAFQEYREALEKAMDGGGRSSDDSDNDNEESSSEGSAGKAMEDESFLQWERENA